MLVLMIIYLQVIRCGGEILTNLAKTGNWLEGHRFSSNPTDSDITAWTNSLK